MAKFKQLEDCLKVEVDTSEMGPDQIRLLKSMLTMLKHVITTEDESLFFNGSAELLRMCASMIKLSNFTNKLEVDGIPYAEQALEYSMDTVYEQMCGQKVVNYDN